MIKLKYYHYLFILVTVSIALSGCGDFFCSDSDNDSVPTTLRVELPCDEDSGFPNDCVTYTDNVEDVLTVNGEEGKTYNVTVRLRGIVEQKEYYSLFTKSARAKYDVPTDDFMWLDDGEKSSKDTWNIFSIEVSSPPAIYYLNNGSSWIEHCWKFDYEKTLLADAGATITLYADSGGPDGDYPRIILNQESIGGEPLVIPDIPPAPEAFDGQFVQMDIVSKTETIELNSSENLLHLGDNVNDIPYYGVEFTDSGELPSGIKQAILTVEFAGEQPDWVSGVDFFIIDSVENTSVEISVNDTKVGLYFSEIPDDAECIYEHWENFWSYNCPFTVTKDVTDLIVEGINSVSVKSLDGDDFVIAGVYLELTY
ncbi:MAG: hypothetical protein C0608_11395 [Deltaproteobacteria bacterium]|nr:MAG: hypothetical protein C0608_11395 [Deltaproteobacteria bacterium]